MESAKELGCNFVRLVHYPHSETKVKEAEKMGLMVWSELPVYQHIHFSDSLLPNKLEQMLIEMVGRDKNRCRVVAGAFHTKPIPVRPTGMTPLLN